MEEVRKVIAEIERKLSKLKGNLVAVRSENEVLQEKVQVLSERLEQREQEVKDFQEKIDVLSQRDDFVVQSQEKNEHNDQIDALVREIDECMSRLKQ